jgi:hypothetical protein
MKTHGGMEVAHAFLTSTLDGGEWPAERVDRFTPRKETRHSLDLDASGELLKICTLHQMLLRWWWLSRMEWAGNITCMGRWAMSTKFRSGNPKGRALGRWRRWEDNIRVDLLGIGWEGVDCIYLAQDRVRWWAFVNTVMNCIPQRAGNFSTIWSTISFSIRALPHGVS